MTTYNYHTTAPPKQAAENTIHLSTHYFPLHFAVKTFSLLILNAGRYKSAAVWIFSHLMHCRPYLPDRINSYHHLLPRIFKCFSGKIPQRNKQKPKPFQIFATLTSLIYNSIQVLQESHWPLAWVQIAYTFFFIDSTYLTWFLMCHLLPFPL